MIFTKNNKIMIGCKEAFTKETLLWILYVSICVLVILASITVGLNNYVK